MSTARDDPRTWLTTAPDKLVSQSVKRYISLLATLRSITRKRVTYSGESSVGRGWLPTTCTSFRGCCTREDWPMSMLNSSSDRSGGGNGNGNCNGNVQAMLRLLQ